MNVCSVCTGGWAGERGEGSGLWVQVAGAWALNHGPLEGTDSRTRCGLCAGVRDGGCPWGQDSCPSEGLGRDFADHMGVCVCVCGRGSGCWWLPRTDSPPPQTAGFSPQAAPSSAQRVPDLPSPKQEVFPGNHPRLTSRADSAAGRVAWNLIFVWATRGLPRCHGHLGRERGHGHFQKTSLLLMGADTDTPEQGVPAPRGTASLVEGTPSGRLRPGAFLGLLAAPLTVWSRVMWGTRSSSPSACGSADTSVADVYTLRLVRSRPSVVVILWNLVSL